MGSIEALCVGETMALVTPVRPEPLETAGLFAIGAGGAESNVAIYLAGLGHRAAWAGRVGADPLGRRLVSALARRGVDVSLVETDPQAPTGAYFKDPGPDGTRVHYYRAGSAASRMDEDFLVGADLRGVRLVHLSGITPRLSASCARLIDRLLTDRPAPDCVLSFDVNYRPGLWTPAAAADRLRSLAQLADVVLVGLDEAGVLWDAGTAKQVRALLDRPATVVVKDGGAAATSYGRAVTQVPAPRVRVTEPVGAGDAFAAGYLSAMLGGMDEVRRLRLGHLLAAGSLLTTEDHIAVPGEAIRGRLLALGEREWAELTIDSSLPTDAAPAGDPEER